jgi:YHS domain-containing protein
VAAAFATAGLVDPVNKNRQGVALKGYDPVAYFRVSGPVKGSPQFSYSWMNATWHFSSAENRDAFAKEPEKYAPQFGGYCAWAVSNNYTADIDPEAWKIIDGKLYLNYNKDVQKKWQEGVLERIADSNKNWPKLHK